MKLFRLFWILAWVFTFGSGIFAQVPNLELNVRYNTAFSRYEVWTRPSGTQPSFNWGPSQISIVTPASVPDAPFNVTSVVGGAWLDNSNVYAPAAAPGSDFHGVGSLGAPTSFTANVEVLVFHFTLPGGGCTPGLRLYINDVDPNSSAAGFFGGDFYNTIFAIVPGFPGGYESYIGNYNNGGTSCNNPPVANNDTPTTPEDIPITFNPLTNDTDDGMLVPSTLDLDPTTPGIQTTFTIPNQGTFVSNPVTGAVTFTPVLNYNGTTTPITYVICDNGTPVLCDDATIIVTVTPVNDPPVAVNDVATTPEDTPVTFPVTGNDTDVDGAIDLATLDLDPATAGIQTTFTVAGQGTFVANPVTGAVTFTPVANYNGTTTPVLYSVCDNGTPLPAQCATATITVTVTPVNDPPVAVNDVVTTPEDTPTSITILSNDTDVDGTLVPSTVDLDPATAGIQTTFTVPGQGTYTVNPSGVVTFTPVLNYNGTTTPVPYSVCDNGTPLPALCATATITVTVTPVNDPPVAVNDVATTSEDTPVTFPVTGNDTDIDGAIDPATLDLDPATAGVQTTFTVAGQGTFVANPATGAVTFTPVLNYNGTTTPVLYSVCDNGTPLPAQCATATITVTVTPVNDPPVAVNDVVTTPEDTPINIAILSNDTDVDGTLVPTTVDLDPATAGIQTTFTIPGQGTYTVNPSGIVTFTPVLNYNGTTTPVPYSVCDNGTPLPAQCATATITVTVTPVNDPPVAVNDVVTTPEDTPINIAILSNDTDVDGILVPTTVDLDPATAGTQTTFTVPGQGTYTVNPSGIVTFTPVLNYNGTTTPVPYSVCDNGTPLPAQCATATITVTVTPVNDPPTIAQPPVTTLEDTPIVICPTIADPDAGNVLTISLCNVPLNGTAAVGPGNCITFTPALNFNGVTTVCIQVCDQGALCATVNVPVTVTPVNDPPVAVNDVVTTPEDTPINISILSNDTDVDGTLVPTTVDLDPATAGIQTTFTVPGQGTYTVNPSGVVTFTPVLNYNGTTTPVPYSVCDNGTPLPAQCATATITVTVTPVNDPPIAVNDVATTPEDTPVTFPVTSNDTDSDGAINPATLDLDPATAGVQTTFTVAGQGTFVANPVTGAVTFTPVANYNGTTTPVLYSVCDNGTPLPAQCATATITVTVTPVNDPPVAVNDVVTTPEDTPINIAILSNDTDVDGILVPTTVDLDPATAGIQTTFTIPGQGTYTVNPSGIVTFTPVLNYNGTTTPVPYSVCDNGTPLPAQCATATITVTVTPVNDPPVAVNDVVTTPEDTPINIAILSNDTDVDGILVPTTVDLDPATAGTQTTFTVPGQGTYTVNPSGIVTFTPVLNYNGTTTPVPYSVCDNGTPLPAQCATATITVTVMPVNDPPTIAQPPVTTPEDTPIVICPTIADPDAGNVLTISLCNVPLNGTAAVGPGNCITFTPALNFNGVTTVCIQVCDQGALCATVNVPVTVTPVNDPPVAVNDVATTPEDTPVTFPVTGNDTDVDGAIDPATLDLDPATAGVQTTFTVAGQGMFVANPATGAVTFTPVLNYNGTTTPVLYSVCDNGTPLPALCATATITVTVTPVNDPPTIAQPPVTTPEDTPIVICPTIADPDAGNVLTISLCNTPLNGTAAVGPGNCITFTPALNFNGVTTVCIQVCDQGALCATVNVPVTVTPVNDPPVAVNDVVTTPEDTPINISILSNDTDVDGTLVPTTVDLDPATPGIQTTFIVPGQGTYTVNPSGVVTFTPVLNYNGTTTPVPYSVCDNGTPLPPQCATATITVTVTPVNDPPVAVNDVATTPEDTPVTFPVTSNDTDSDGAINPATLDLDPATAGVQTTFTVAGQGTFVANPVTGAVTFTPVANYNGTTTPIPYSVCDNGTPLPAQCATATITVTVTPVNDPPTIAQPPVTTPEDTPIVICPTIADPDAGNVLTISLCNVPLNGTAAVGPGNCITFTPALNFNGVTTVCIQVCDQGALCATVNVPVTVTPVNDPPVAVNDVVTTPEDTPINISILSNDTDLDGTLVPSTVDLDPATPGIQTTFTVPSQGTFVVNPVTGVVTFTPVPNYSGTTTPISYSVCDNGTPLPALCATATISVVVVFDPIAKLQLKVMLQGALIGTSNGLMRDDLRSGGYIPLTEPYGALAVAGNTRFTHVGGGGGETTTLSVLAANAGTPNAIVDWVFVELRSALDSSVVLLTRSALVQRDGDVVSAFDGVSRLNFSGIVGQLYFVTVKHRNHIGAMTSSRITMNNDATLVDFTTATNAQVYNRPGAINYDGSEMVTVQGMRALWAGNTNANNKVKYQGTASDNTSILTQSLNHPNNTLGTYNFNAAFGYYSGDVNMDGKVKYQGTSNDVSYIFVNVIGLYTTLNTAGLYNYDLFLEQLP